MDRPTVILNMVVKDEGAVIERSLRSVMPFIDYWVIVDTGSTDDTKDKIRATLKGIPGELHEREWKGFGPSRNEALELAQAAAKEGNGDYLLFTDGSLVWTLEEGFEFPVLTHDGYLVKMRQGNTSWKLVMLAKAGKPLFYGDSKSHSTLNCKGQFVQSILKGITIEARGDGARRSSKDSYKKYERDIEVFSAQLQEDPKNTRAMFYLAQSYKDLKDYSKALNCYLQRSLNPGGFPEEIWYSHYQVGVMHECLGNDWNMAEHAYFKAYQVRPLRAEPLLRIARYYRKNQEYGHAHLFACAMKDMPYPENDLLFVDESVYDWAGLDEYAISAQRVGKLKEARAANEQLLASGKLPEREVARIKANLKFC